MTSTPHNLFNLSVYLYDEGYYDSFKKGTDEKILTGLIQGAFNRALSERDLVFNPDETRVFDMGSGPCDTSLRYYLTSGFKSKKVVVRAVDENARFIGGKDLATGEDIPYLQCDAYKNFQAVQKEFGVRGIELDFRSSQADAFNGQSIANASVDGDIKPNSFDLAFLSHLFYHVAPQGGLSSGQRLDQALNDIARKTLRKEGVAVAYHVAIGGPDDNYSFQYFRDNFGSKSDSASRHSNTDAMDTKDPATQIERSCARQGIGCRTMRYTTKLRFSAGLFTPAGKVKDEIKAIFKNPARYHELLETPGLYEDLKRIYFIVQRSAHELAADKSETGLDNLMDKTLKAIENASDEHGHYLITHEKMQIITNPERSSRTQEKADAALQEVELRLEGLYEQATQKFVARVAGQSDHYPA